LKFAIRWLIIFDFTLRFQVWGFTSFLIFDNLRVIYKASVFLVTIVLSSQSPYNSDISPRNLWDPFLEGDMFYLILNIELSVTERNYDFASTYCLPLLLDVSESDLAVRLTSNSSLVASLLRWPIIKLNCSSSSSSSVF